MSANLIRKKKQKGGVKRIRKKKQQRIKGGAKTLCFF